MRKHLTTLIVAAALVAGSRPAAAVETSAPAPSQPGCSMSDDLTTGGGWLLPGPPKKRTFGLIAGIGPNAPFVGHLDFNNHLTDTRLKGDVITYTPNTGNTRQMSGEAEVNGEQTTFDLEVTDVDDPQRMDTFHLTYVTTTETVTEQGVVGGGNIEIRPMCPFAAAAAAGSGP